MEQEKKDTNLEESQEKEVSLVEAKHPVSQLLDKFSASVNLDQMLPDGISYMNYIVRFKNVIRNKPELKNLLLSTAKSDQNLRSQMLYSLIFCVAHGLVPDGEEVVIIPFKGNNPSITTVICKDGFQKMARRKGVNVDVAVIFKGQPHRVFFNEIGARRIEAELGWRPNDHVVVKNDNGRNIYWNYDTATLNDYWENVLLVAAIATDGTKHIRTEVMYVDEIKRCSKSAKTDKFWKAHPKRMFEKTVLRRLCKEIKILDVRTDIVVEREEGVIDMIDAPTKNSVDGIVDSTTRPDRLLIPTSFDIDTSEDENNEDEPDNN